MSFPSAPWHARRSTGGEDAQINGLADWRPLGQAWLPAEHRHHPRAWACAHWTPDALHFRVLFHGAPGSNRARRLNERTWELGDVCEIFLQAAGVEDYVEIHVTPENERLQLRWPPGGLTRLRAGESPLEAFTENDPQWVQSRVERFASGWQVDLRIPASCLALPALEEPLRFRAAACAYRYRETEPEPELISTAPFPSLGFHQPSHWHELLLVPAAPSVSANTAIVPSLRPDYPPERLAGWFFRHEETIGQTRAHPVRLAFVGDSITAGWLDRGREPWIQNFAPLGSANLGISGDRTQQVLWRLSRPELAQLHPRVAVILIGTNNLDAGLGDAPSLTPRNTVQEIIAGIWQVVNATCTRWTGVRILLLGILPRGEADGAHRRALTTINHELAQPRHDAVRFLDVGSHLLNGDGSLNDAFQPDGVHLSAQGYTMLADAIAAPIRALLEDSA